MVLEPHPTRKQPSAAVRQLWSDYADWLIALPFPLRDDEPLDDSWERFLCERRKAKEKARLRGVYAHRKANRQAQMTHREEQYQTALQLKTPWALAECARRTARQARGDQRKAAVGQPVGRPINPHSKRQQRIATQPLRNAARQEREAKRTASRVQFEEEQRQLAEHRKRVEAQRNEIQLHHEERKRRFHLLWEQLMAEHGLSSDVALNLSIKVNTHLFGRDAFALLPDDCIAVDGAEHRTHLLHLAIDEMAAGCDAATLARYIKAKELPDALAARVCEAPLIVEYLKPEMQRSWNQHMSAAYAARRLKHDSSK